MHFGERFYWELRVRPRGDKDPYTEAGEYRDKLAKLPVQVEDYIARLNPPPYWRKLANRLPSMIYYLHSQTRVSAEGQQAIINGYLPAAAGPNLLAATELTLASRPGAAVVAGGPSEPQIKTFEDLLNQRISLAFPQQSLEFAIRDLGDEVKDQFKSLPFEPTIKILGEDLKLDGITRNQQVRDFDQQNKTIAEILTALVMKANPVTTVKSPSEKDQKLIWVLGPDPTEPSRKILLITTRQAAEAKKYELPAVFKG